MQNERYWVVWKSLTVALCAVSAERRASHTPLYILRSLPTLLVPLNWGPLARTYLEFSFLSTGPCGVLSRVVLFCCRYLLGTWVCTQALFVGSLVWARS